LQGLTATYITKITGQGKPVILLHGFLEDHTMWEGLLPALLAWGFKVIEVDLPCHGLSRYTEEECSMSDMAESVVALVDYLQLENPHIIGHSMGGYVGLAILKTFAADLTLLHSNFWADDKVKKNNRNRVIEIVQKNKPLFVQEAIPALFYAANKAQLKNEIAALKVTAMGIPAKEIIAATRGLRDRPYQAEVMNKHKVNIIHGTQDPIISRKQLEKEIEQLEQDPDIFYIEDCGHMSFLEKPEQLIKALKQVLFR
jgi:2-succinyl-6-hydroxy-2,4-cyclohexadiene-1-carboxylate synthase